MTAQPKNATMTYFMRLLRSGVCVAGVGIAAAAVAPACGRAPVVGVGIETFGLALGCALAFGTAGLGSEAFFDFPMALQPNAYASPRINSFPTSR